MECADFSVPVIQVCNLQEGFQTDTQAMAETKERGIQEMTDHIPRITPLSCTLAERTQKRGQSAGCGRRIRQRRTVPKIFCKTASSSSTK